MSDDLEKQADGTHLFKRPHILHSSCEKEKVISIKKSYQLEFCVWL